MRVVVAEDSLLTREGIVRVLRAADIDVVAEVSDPDALLVAVRRESPDVAIVDIRMPPTHTDEGLRAAATIRAQHPRVGVLVLSQYLHTGTAVELISNNSGRIGYLLKERLGDVAELVHAVRRIAFGGSVVDPLVAERLLDAQRDPDPLADLTPREREVLKLIAEGRSNAAIAERLVISPKTIESHVKSILGKLQIAETAEDHRRVRAVLTYLHADEAA